jgi:hypothetical protein
MHTATRGLATPSKATSSPPSWHALPVTSPGNQRLAESVGKGRAGAAGSTSGYVSSSKWPDGWVWPGEKALVPSALLPEEKALLKEKAFLSLPSTGAGSEAMAEARGGDGGDVGVGGGVRAERGEQEGASSQGDAVQLPGLGERGASKSPTPSLSPARSPFH